MEMYFDQFSTWKINMHIKLTETNAIKILNLSTIN